MTTGTRSSSDNAVWTATDLAGDPHRATDKAARVRRMFAGIAASYDLNNRLHSFGRDQAWRRAAVRLVEAGAADRVLDVACGTGDLAEAFADAGAAQVVGVDFTEEMLDLARAKARRRRRRPGAPAPEYRSGDALALEFDHESFDVVSIAFGLRNVSDPAAALAEFARVLRPGGRLVILEFGEPRLPIVRGLSRLYTTRIMPLTATLLARDRTGAYRYLPRSVNTFATPESLAAMMTAAGFVDLRQRSLDLGICVASAGAKPRQPQPSGPVR